MKEVKKERYAGPFTDPPFEHFIQSPIGLVPKDQGKDTRLIFHLSYPRSGQSISSETPKGLCSVHYPDFNDAIKLILAQDALQSNCGTIFVGKSDFSSTFRNLPISPLDFPLLVMVARNPVDNKWYFFVDKCLPFGASISCAHFQEFSDTVAFIFLKKTGKKAVNYLDDFLFVALLKSLCDGQIACFLDICDIIGFPVSMDKTVWGENVIIFLELLIDCINRVVSIPVEKIDKAIEIITRLLNKKSSKVTIKELQKLCGYLNFICRAIVPGRAFLHRLYSLTTRKTKSGKLLLPHHHIKLTSESKSDLAMWLQFLHSPQVYARPFVDFSHEFSAMEIDMFSDSSGNFGLGFGAIYKTNWMFGKWMESCPNIAELKPMIEYLKLFAVTAAVLAWIQNEQNKRICLFCNNESVMHTINQSSSSCRNCMVLIRLLVEAGLKFNVRIFARHLSGKLNILSDSLSRLRLDKFWLQAQKEGRTFNAKSTRIPETIWPIDKIWLK